MTYWHKLMNITYVNYYSPGTEIISEFPVWICGIRHDSLHFVRWINSWISFEKASNNAQSASMSCRQQV